VLKYIKNNRWKLSFIICFLAFSYVTFCYLKIAKTSGELLYVARFQDQIINDQYDLIEKQNIMIKLLLDKLKNKDLNYVSFH